MSFFPAVCPGTVIDVQTCFGFPVEKNCFLGDSEIRTGFLYLTGRLPSSVQLPSKHSDGGEGVNGGELFCCCSTETVKVGRFKHFKHLSDQRPVDDFVLNEL